MFLHRRRAIQSADPDRVQSRIISISQLSIYFVCHQIFARDFNHIFRCDFKSVFFSKLISGLSASFLTLPIA